MLLCNESLQCQASAAKQLLRNIATRFEWKTVNSSKRLTYGGFGPGVVTHIKYMYTVVRGKPTLFPQMMRNSSKGRISVLKMMQNKKDEY